MNAAPRVKSGVHVEGRPEWIFIKVHTHGTQERDMDTLLGAEMEAMHAHLECAYNDGTDFVLHYVTAREAYNIVKAAEVARRKGVKVVALTGRDETPITELADVSIVTPAGRWADRVQELHIKVIHILVQLIERVALGVE